MVRRCADVTDAELGVLEVLWDEGPSTIRQLSDRLYPDGGPAHYATVQKLLERLEAKRHVRRRRRERVNVYAATVRRQDLIWRRLRELADRLCEGSLAPLLTQLVGSSRLTREELRELRRMVDRAGEAGATDRSSS
jgi:predicted transcriptional regulator